ncbi:MAG: restriction endonuclease subunit S [Anaerolineales bacterium]|nr:restriction endonuclease subunit S [Anaerolineales bacterium]
MSSNEEWTTYKLKYLCTKIGSGATPRGGKETYLDEGPYALIRSQNVLDFFFSYDGLAFIDESQANQLSNVEVQERDVLLNITGDSVARVCQVPITLLPARVNQHVSIIRTNNTKLIPEYLKYFLLNPKFKSHLLGLASVGATRNALTKGMIEDFDINLPPLSTQRRIADILSALDEKIELNRQTNATLEAIAQAIFKEWFVDFNLPVWNYDLNDGMNTMITSGENHSPSGNQKNHSADGALPQGWRVGRLEEIISNFDSKRIPVSSREREKRKGIYPYYGAASIVDYIDDFLFDGVYLLMGEDGTVITDDEKPVLQYVTGKFWVNNHAHVLQGKDIFSTEFVYLALKNTNVKHIVTGAVQPKINQGNMNSLPVIIPDIETLNTFQNAIKPIFAYVLEVEQQSTTLASLRDALLPKLMSGEVNV